MLLSKSFLNDAKCEIEDAVAKAVVEPEEVKEVEPEEVKEVEPEEVKEVEPEEVKEVEPESPEAEPISKDYTLPSKPKTPKPVDATKCSFLLQSGTRKGQPCGRPVKEGGFCGVHQKKPEITNISDPSKCNCLILSGARKGQICGRTAKENGLCAIHLKSCPSRLPTEPTQQPAQIVQPVLPTKCQCIIQSGKNRNQICGRNVQPGTTTCKFHKEVCVKPKEPVEIIETVEPEQKDSDDSDIETDIKEVMPESAKPESAKPESAKPESAKPESAKPESTKPESAEISDAEFDEAEFEAEFEAELEKVMNEPDPDQEEEPVEPREPDILPEPIERDTWKVIQVSEKELMNILDSTQILDIDTEQMNYLDYQIRKCFAY